jgi:ribosome recycling factor
MFIFQITKDDARAASETIKHIYDHFAALGDAALNTKLKELVGK